MFPSLDTLEEAATRARLDVRRLLCAAAADNDVTVLAVELAGLDEQLDALLARLRRLQKYKKRTTGREQ